MIIICAVTDVLPALSLAYEEAEDGLLTRPPRDVKKDRLVDWKLLVHAYLVVGMLECLCAMSMAFWYMQRQGVYFSDLVLAYGAWKNGLTNDRVNEVLYVAQSIYFFTLVVGPPRALWRPNCSWFSIQIMQWGNLLATRTRRLSIFQHPPIFNKAGKGNWRIIPAMLAALAFCLFFS